MSLVVSCCLLLSLVVSSLVVSCLLLSLVSCLLSLVSCLWSLVSFWGLMSFGLLLSLVVSCCLLLSLVVSRLVVSCLLLSLVSCLLSLVPCLMSHVSCLMSHVSCLLSHVSIWGLMLFGLVLSDPPLPYMERRVRMCWIGKRIPQRLSLLSTLEREDLVLFLQSF
jgi:hypothetical protein